MAVLEGRRVHMVVGNDYLAGREAALAERVFGLLGVTVGGIQEKVSEENGEARRRAYRCNLVYGSHTAFGFDCLRDRLGEKPMQPTPDIAVIDEADRVLIDEGRTPLVISRKITVDSESYRAADGVARELMDRGGAPERSPFYGVDSEHRWQIQLTGQGVKRVETVGGNIGQVEQALRAHLLYEKDRVYIVRDGRVVILDEQNGRPEPGRKFSQELHQAIEVKEEVDITPEETVEVRVLVQDYFRGYKKLTRMTGTGKDRAAEFKARFGLEVGMVPTRRTPARVDHEDRVFRDGEARDGGLVEDIVHHSRDLGRPVLVGTGSVADSERISNGRNRSSALIMV